MNSFWRLTGLAAFMVTGVAINLAEAAECLNYQDAVNLTGTLSRKRFPGPSNYESIAKGDAAEIAIILRLTKPSCVAADPSNEFSVAVPKLEALQLVLDKTGWTDAARLRGRPVSVTGKLFGAHTGHHHTAVLLDEARIGGP